MLNEAPTCVKLETDTQNNQQQQPTPTLKSTISKHATKPLQKKKKKW